MPIPPPKLVPPAKPLPPAKPVVPPPDDERQTVLLVGSGDPMEAALSLALGRYGLSVEASTMKDAMQAVFVHAPDLAVLLGDAAKEEGGEVLAKLAGRASTAVVPVALLSDDPDLERKLRAFRYGAVAVVPRSPSADEMARRIADIVHELPERDKSQGADLGETTLDELIRLVSTRLRTGILSVKAEGQSEGARIVLRGGQPVTEAIEQLVASIRPLVASPSGPLAFEFEEQPTGRLAAIADAEIAPPGEIDVRSILAGRRFVLVERSPSRADDLVQALRALGAFVAVVDGEGQGMEKARAIAPEIVVVDARGIGGWASPALRTIRHDLRLRWAALLVARADEIWPEGAPGADLSRLAAGVRPLIEVDLSLTERAKAEEKFSSRIESTGPERFLRALLASGKTLHVRVQHPRAIVDLDLAEGLVVGATAKGQREATAGKSAFPGKPVEASGAAALAVLLGLSTGRAQVEQRKAPSIANLMSPLDDAIAAADREAPPIRPSLPPPSSPPSGSPPGRSDSARPMFPSALLNDPPELLRQLESLLIDLRQSIPPGTTAREGSVAGAVTTASYAASTAATEAPKPATEQPRPLGGGTLKPSAIPRPGAIPGPAPVPTLGATRKKTLVGVMAPVIPRPPPSAPPTEESAPEISVPAISVPAIPLPPSAVVSAVPSAHEPRPSAPSTEDLANLLEPESTEHELPARGDPSGAYPPAIPSPVSVPPTALPAMPAPPPAPLMPAQASPSPVAPALDDDELASVKPKRRGLGVVLALLTLLLLAGGGGAAWWFVMGPGAAGPGTSTVAGAGPGAGAGAGAGAGTGAGPAAGAGAGTGSEAGAAPTTIADAGTLAPADAGAPDAGLVVADAGTDAGTSDAGMDAGLDSGVDAGAPEEELLAGGEEEPLGDDAVDDATLDVTERRARIEYLIDRANFRRRRGEAPGATADYEAILRMEPANARALAGLARLYLDRGRGADAVTYARRLTRFHPSQPANHVLLGDCLLASGDRSAAIRAFQAALRIAPSYRVARDRISDLPPR